MFEVRELSKSYGDVKALDDVSLKLGAGATTVLIGPSGCGKSTLLNCLNGLVRPDSGDVLVRDSPLPAGDELVELRRHIGYVIQDGGLFNHLTARQNVELVAKLTGWDESRRAQRVGELAELVHLDREVLDRYPDQLSGGQRQRVGLMRALMRDPEALLLDEPMGALDPMTRANLQRDLRDIFADLKKTVVLVTHDLAEAAYLGDVIVLMRAGRIEQVGDMSDLRETPANGFVTEFLDAQREIAEALR